MSDTIVMRHPTLPAHQEIEVLRDAMPHYTAAGWQLVPQEELDERAAMAKAQAEDEAAAAEQPGESETADEPEKSEPAESTDERPARSRTKAATKKDEES